MFSFYVFFLVKTNKSMTIIIITVNMESNSLHRVRLCSKALLFYLVWFHSQGAYAAVSHRYTECAVASVPDSAGLGNKDIDLPSLFIFHTDSS